MFCKRLNGKSQLDFLHIIFRPVPTGILRNKIADSPYQVRMGSLGLK